jgi:hypothetical protein
MNSSAEQSVTISPSITSATPCVYTTDFYAWTQQQSALLREGRFGEVDIPHLIEEIESLGRSEKRELESRLTILLMHFLKWQFQTAQRERHERSWLATIRHQRTELRKLLRDNPSLQAYQESAFSEAYQDARYEAEAETGLSRATFPDSVPYTVENVLDASWLPAAD